MPIQRYLNPRNDLVFKKIFGTEKNKNVLHNFLNELITHDTHGKRVRPDIAEITLINPSFAPEIQIEKQSIVDVLCKDEKDHQYIVEMQIARVPGFEKRAQYYASRAYASQLNEGGNYNALKDVVFVAVVDFEMFSDTKEYKSMHHIVNQKNGKCYLQDLNFVFIELPKFNKKSNELVNMEEKWCYFLKHGEDCTENEVRHLISNRGKVIKQAYETMKIHNWSESELLGYESYMKHTLDKTLLERERIRFEKECTERGVQRGLKKGLEKGLKKGLEEGLEKVRKEKKEIIKNMIAKNIDCNTIAEVVGLSEEEVKDIQGTK